MNRRVASARANGSLGGKQGSRNLTEDQREQRARLAGQSTLNTYGREYYSFLGKMNRTIQPQVKKQEIKISAATRRIAAMM
jgi:hypothetical protein